MVISLAFPAVLSFTLTCLPTRPLSVGVAPPLVEDALPLDDELRPPPFIDTPAGTKSVLIVPRLPSLIVMVFSLTAVTSPLTEESGLLRPLAIE